MGERAFPFLRTNRRPPKPRRTGVTEIRGPYYTVLGKRQLADLLETAGEWADALKFAGGSFTLMPRHALRELIDLCHENSVKVSTGGFIEYVLTQGSDAVERYLLECREVGFDIVELSTGFITLPEDDVLRLTERVQKLGMLAKPEVGIQFGAGGASPVSELESEGVSDPARAIRVARRCLDAGAYMIMIESEGITENVKRWRTEVASQFAAELGLANVMFEAADPDVFPWYIKSYGPEVNLFVDHSQVIQLECLRSGIWGTKSLWGRVLTYQPEGQAPAAGPRQGSRQPKSVPRNPGAARRKTRPAR